MPALLVVGVRGLGREIARHFAARGYGVVAAARTKADVEAVAQETGGLGVVADLGDRASLQALVEQAAARYGRIDLCVAAQTSGARFRLTPVLEADEEDLRLGLHGYPLATLRLLQAVAPHQIAQGGGTFVQIGSSGLRPPRPGFAALAAPQHALRALLAGAAQELKEKRVHVAYLAVEGQLATPASAAWIARHGPERAVPPVEVARAVEYLHGQDPRAWTAELAVRPAAVE